MKATRKIVSFLLLALYSFVLLHNFVPHTHQESDFTAPHSHEYEHTHSHAHGHDHSHQSEKEQQGQSPLLNFLLSIIGEHSIQFNAEDEHFSTYQSGKKLNVVEIAIAQILPHHDFSWHHPPPQGVKSNFFLYDFSLKKGDKFCCSPLRAPPVSG